MFRMRLSPLRARKIEWALHGPVIDEDVPHCKIGHSELSLCAAREDLQIRLGRCTRTSVSEKSALYGCYLLLGLSHP